VTDPARPAPRTSRKALWRASIAHAPRNPFRIRDGALEIFEDGGLLLDEDGRVAAVGPFEKVRATFETATIVERPGAWIFPGGVDLHVHFPQTRVVASPAAKLLDWLERYVFPEEARFSDSAYATAAAESFCDLLLRNGTTTALVFGSHDPGAVDSCFAAAKKRGLRVALGKTLHGRDVPSTMLDRPGEALDACRALIASWHQKGKSRFVVTPRFALTSTPETFDVCRALLDETPDLLTTTHVSENDDEVAKTAERFPTARHYVDVYDREGLLGPRSILAHGVKLKAAERAVLAARGATVAHCPSSNFFLGSGVLPLKETVAAGVRVGLGTDVGAGTSLSLFAELADAYKASALSGAPLSAAELLWLSTAGGAEALGLTGTCGAFVRGAAGDCVVVDPSRDALLAERLAFARDAESKLFAILLLCRGACVAETIVDGAVVYAAAPNR
jgi:guanine deaminase